MNSVRQTRQQCGYCRALAFPLLHINYEDKVVITIDQLRKTSLSCRACRVIHDGLVAFFGSEALKPLTSTKITIFKSSPMKTPMGVYLQSQGLAPKMRHSLQFYTHSDAPSIWPAIGAARDVSDDSSTDDCMALAKYWLDECISSHAHCSRHSPRRLPTRVINVGSSQMEPYLHITEDIGEYAALSHCWGGASPLKTTETNIDERRRGIPFDCFPKTFRDAILITRALGLKYLWIDSLCIVQDSDDWELEASNMIDYYMNAKVTIAADGAANSLEGCFISSNYRNNRMATVECPGLNGATTVYVRLNAGSANHQGCHLNPAKDKGYHNQLNTRAWALQERILSRRILHYTAAEVTWECATKRCCECSLQDWDNWADVLKRKLLGASPRISATVEGAPVRPEDLDNVLQSDWQGLVHGFTSRQLTFASDRLPAFSGLAGAVQKLTSDTYLAGLFKSELHAHLCWQTSNPSNFTVKSPLVSKRHSQYHAPSWSWASVTGEIFYNYTQSKPPQWKLISRIQIHEVECVPTGKNLFGPASGFLKCTGYMVSVKLTPRKNKSGEVLEPRSFTVTPTSSLQPSGVLLPDVTDGSEVLHQQYSMLIVASKDAAPGDMVFKKRTHQPFCIVLKQRADSSSYERIGLASSESTHRADMKGQSWDDWMAVSEEKTVTIV